MFNRQNKCSLFDILGQFPIVETFLEPVIRHCVENLPTFQYSLFPLIHYNFINIINVTNNYMGNSVIKHITESSPTKLYLCLIQSSCKAAVIILIVMFIRKIKDHGTEHAGPGVGQITIFLEIGLNIGIEICFHALVSYLITEMQKIVEIS